MNELDAIDITLLDLLQHDGRISNADLAQRVGLAPATVLRRVKLLEERGYIRGYTALLDPLQLDLPITAFIFIETDYTCSLDELAVTLGELPGVQEVHRTIGEWCILLKVRTQTPQSLEHLLARTIRRMAGIRRSETILATSSPVETTCLALPKAAAVTPSDALAE